MVKGITFFGAVATLPMLSQIQPESVVGKLAVGSAQFILSVVVVAEAYAIYKMFKLWRADVEAQREDYKTDKEELKKLVEENARANTQVATTNTQLKESVYHFAEVVKGLEK